MKKFILMTSIFFLISPWSFADDYKPTEQTITLREGWNAIAFTVKPDYVFMIDVIDPLIKEGSFELMMNERGDMLWSKYNLNDLSNVRFDMGYKIKVNQDTELKVQGTHLNYPLNISLRSGWGLFPYASSESQNALMVLEEVLNDLVIVKDGQGNEIIFKDDQWLNGIGAFEPGKAYEIKMKNDVNVSLVSPFVCGALLPYEFQNYKTVQIGHQCWMAENLNIGTMINGLKNQTNNGIIEKYCYGNMKSSCDLYGGLYQFNEALNHRSAEIVQGICPQDWHVPTDSDWYLLSSYLDRSIKFQNNQGFHGTNIFTALLDSGFEVKFAGYRYPAFDNNFAGHDLLTFFWTATKDKLGKSWSRTMNNSYDTINRNSYSSNYGYAIRCVKND